MNTIDESKQQTTTADASLDLTSNNSGRRRDSSSIQQGTTTRRQQRGSSIFQKAQKSFMRSGGQRGASVETLRGTTGADFEGKARIQRSSAGGLGYCCCGGCFFGCLDDGEEKESKKERLLLIKGPFCFVFKNEDAASPKYAIALVNLKAVAKQGHSNIVQLQTHLGDVEYEVVFDSSSSAEKDGHVVVAAANLFRRVVQQQAAAAETDRVRKRLGHEHLLVHSKSVRYAEGIAQKKCKEQPDAPISASDIVANMPVIHPSGM